MPGTSSIHLITPRRMKSATFSLKASTRSSFLSFASKFFIILIQADSLVGSCDNNSLYGYSAVYVLSLNVKDSFTIFACSSCLVGSGRCDFLQSLQLLHLLHLLIGWTLIESVVNSLRRTSFDSGHMDAI